MVYRCNIVDEAKKQRQDGTLFSVWTLDDKIFAKISSDGNFLTRRFGQLINQIKLKNHF